MLAFGRKNLSEYSLEECLSHLQDLTKLRKGWYDGQGEEISRDAITLAKGFLQSVDYPRPYTYPREDGGVQLEWDHKGKPQALSFRPSEDSRWVLIDYLPSGNEDNIIMWATSNDRDHSNLYESMKQTITYYKK